MFGGALDIMRLAEGIIKAKISNIIDKPLVIRIKGVFEKEVTEMMENFLASNENANQSIWMVKELDKAALKAVRLASESEFEDLIKEQEAIKKK